MKILKQVAVEATEDEVIAELQNHLFKEFRTYFIPGDIVRFKKNPGLDYTPEVAIILSVREDAKMVNIGYFSYDGNYDKMNIESEYLLMHKRSKFDPLRGEVLIPPAVDPNPDSPF